MKAAEVAPPEDTGLVKSRDLALDVSRSSRTSSFKSLRPRRRRPSSDDGTSESVMLFRLASSTRESLNRIVVPSCIRCPSLSSSSDHRSLPLELGEGIQYVNIRGTCQHGDIVTAMEVAREERKPLFAYFVEWPGSEEALEVASGIFSHPDLVKVINTSFVPAAFNTRDRRNEQYNMAHKYWGGALATSLHGYVRILSPDGITVLAGTRILHSIDAMHQVCMAMLMALTAEGQEVPIALKNQINPMRKGLD
jgi:hypothetical protein